MGGIVSFLRPSQHTIYIFPENVKSASFAPFHTSPGELAVNVAGRYSYSRGWRGVKFFRVEAGDSADIMRGCVDLKDFIKDDKMVDPSLPIPDGTWLIATGESEGELSRLRATIPSSRLLLPVPPLTKVVHPFPALSHLTIFCSDSCCRRNKHR
jgi:hypothetical protein